MPLDDEKDLYELVRSMVCKESPPKRGRPRTGHEKAAKYASEVIELELSGMRRSAAVVEVARRNKKTEHHIWSCLKMFRDDVKKFVRFEWLNNAF